jgi:hypothetical protein
MAPESVTPTEHRSAPDTAAGAFAFDSVILGPGDFLILRPRTEFAARHATALAIPAALKGRVLVVDPAAFDVVHVHPVGVAL